MNAEICTANELYKLATEGHRSFSPALRRSYLERALTIYRAQLQRNVCALESRSSLWRNVGVSSLRLAELINPKEVRLVMYHLSEAVRNLTFAWLGRSTEDRKSEWGDRIQELVSDSFERAFRSCMK
jgi:hypothetical protein